MLKCLNARLVFIKATCLFVALSYIIFSCAAGANAQLTSGYGYGNIPLSQGQQQGYAQASSQALPDDWPQPLSVPGMEKVTGLAQGDNNLSYSVRIVSQDGGKVNFQVKAFCVYNPVSDYALLHVLDKPLMGVVDPDKKTLQIDFSPLAAGLKSVEIIDKADVDKVLLQEPDSLVLHTVMSVQSMDPSQVKFSISDMSLLQPDGVLNEFSLPGPVPALYDPATARFSTVAFDELTNVLQQNYVYVQQNTFISVVNQVNVVNVINVVDFGGFGLGGWGGVPYGGYGGYGGIPYGGSCGYGYGGAPYSGFMPYSDPLPLAESRPVLPLTVPDDVPVYGAKHAAHPADQTTPASARLPKKDRPTKKAGDNAYKDKSPAATIQPAAKKTAGPTPMPKQARTTKPVDPKNTKPAQGNAKPQKASVNPQAKQAQASTMPAVKTASGKAKAPDSAPKKNAGASSTPEKTPVKQAQPTQAPAAKSAVTKAKAPAKQAVSKQAPATKTNVARTKAPDSKPARQAVSQPVPAKTTVTKTTPNKAPAAALKSAPAAKKASVPKTSVAKGSKPQQVAKTPARSAPLKQASAPKAAARGAPAKGGRHR